MFKCLVQLKCSGVLFLHIGNSINYKCEMDIVLLGILSVSILSEIEIFQLYEKDGSPIA